jgi:hypothetical protein
MLPSTFEDKLKKEEEMKRRIGARMELARFLQVCAWEGRGTCLWPVSTPALAPYFAAAALLQRPGSRPGW